MTRPPPVTRSSPAPRADYHAYREDLRKDCLHLCAYCTISEVEAGGVGFEIDHYLPQEHFPHLKSDFLNLLWSCRFCNGYKDDFVPGTDHHGVKHFVIRPDENHPDDHLEEAADGTLKPLTPAGICSNRVVLLNREQLVRVRRVRARVADARATTRDALASIVAPSLDQIAPRVRIAFEKLKHDVVQLAAEYAAARRDEVRALARSPSLDPEPNRDKLNADKREYIDQLRVLGVSPPPPKPKKKKKKKPY